MDKITLSGLIETWDAESIATALLALKKDKTLEADILLHYNYFLEAIGGKTLKSLVDLPKKWDKLSNAKKSYFIKDFPDGLPFPVKILNLNASRRVDAWRDSHYSNQVAFSEKILNFKELTELHLIHQQYEEMPESIGDLENLEVLNLHDNDWKSLPESLEKLTKLRVFNVSQNYRLSKIPDLSKFPNLEEVNFNYTKIDSLSDSFFDLKHLKKIVTISSPLDKNMSIMRKIFAAFPNAEIDSNAKKAIELEDQSDAGVYAGLEQIKIRDWDINKLPASLFMADSVKSLTIDCMSLTELADQFDQLQTLEILELKVSDDATEFPKSIYKLKNLKELRINCGFVLLPEGIDALESLEVLEIDAYKLKELPKSFANLKNVKEINLKHVDYDIFSSIATFEHLETLTIDYHSFPFEFEKSLSRLCNLRTFKIKANKPITDDLYKLPAGIEMIELINNGNPSKDHMLSLDKIINHFTGLKRLDVRDYNLSSVSEAILPNYNLKELNFDNVKITQLPDSFSNLKSLTNFRMFDNYLQSLNPSIYECSELEYLRLSKSNISVIPSGISKLQKLKSLGLEGAKVSSFPEDIFEMKNLEKIAIADCPIYSDKNWKALIKRKIKGVRVVRYWYD